MNQVKGVAKWQNAIWQCVWLMLGGRRENKFIIQLNQNNHAGTNTCIGCSNKFTCLNAFNQFRKMPKRSSGKRKENEMEIES